MNILKVLLLFFFLSCTSRVSVPEFVIGSFTDDYSIEYVISEDLFLQKPNIRYHILEWSPSQQYLIARNDSANSYDAGLYSRIDWVKLPNMEPYQWGFCLSAYNAPSADSARAVDIVDRENPKTGCNGYPFSRMKPIEQ